MKKIFYITSSIVLCLLLALTLGCKEKEWPGSINGSITDKATGEPIKSAGVELLPSGQKTLTGSDGEYSFPEVDPGTYKLHITKTGYEELVSDEIVVNSSKPTPYVVQLEKKISTLIVVDDNNEAINTLNFGGSPEVVSRPFNIYNSGFENVTWEISFTAEWIKSCTPLKKGTLYPTQKQALLLTIDRSKFEEGKNYKATLDIMSNVGTRQIEVRATSIAGEEEEDGEYIILKTAKLMVQQKDLGELSLSDADRICKNSTLAGYTDWRLPTLDELVVIYNHRDNIQNLKSASYWSGDEYSVNFGYGALNMGTGSVGYYESSQRHNVRAVRSIETESLPIVEMRRVTDMARGTVVFEGNITSTGYPSYTERGFVYATQPKPTLESAQTKLTSPVTSDAIYSATVTDLPIDQTYYVRAYAVNELGTVYSANEKTFEMQAILPKVGTGKNITKNIGERKATLGGIINDEGYPAYTERGIVYGLLRNPTVEDNMKKVVSGSGTGEFFANLADLEIGNVYYVKAYAINEKGMAYGGEVTLDFHAVLPEVRTDKVTEITETGAVLNGTILSAGDPTYTEKGFVYGTMSLPSFDNPDIVAIPIEGTGTGEYNYSLSGLIDGTTYYVRAYAKVGENVTYGVTSSFKTGNPYYVVLPEVGLMVQKADLGEVDWYTAESLCKNSITAGYTDWRLPTIDELMTIYLKKELIGGFLNGAYWSSTKFDSDDSAYAGIYYYIYFLNGDISNYAGYATRNNVRAVRTITK